jgi:predicted AAA+ superfamily ATPase
MDYRPRVVDAELTEQLATNGAVVIEGPKACGKTETARRQARSEVLLDVSASDRQAAEVDPILVLEPGDRPRLIDEWQIVGSIWNHVRRYVDTSTEPGQFILTGSATPSDDLTRHTGAMRFGRVQMRPMSLFEVSVSSGEISLTALMAGEPTRVADPGVGIHDLVEEVIRGGWPGNRHLDLPAGRRRVRDYLGRIQRTDIGQVDNKRRDPQRVAAVLQSVARNLATQAAFTKIAAEATEPGMAIIGETVSEYLDALTRLFIVEDLPAWNTHLRSKHRLRTTPTRHFVDPSLAVAALGAGTATLLADLNYFGYLFESLVVRDLRVYAQAISGEVFHYRDEKDLEVDAIVDTQEAWGAFEVKLGVNQVDVAARNLLTLAERVDSSKRGEPAVLAVIVGGGYGYVRQDGVHVIPIGALGP